MAYYYVKTGGTATGDTGRFASQQTGAFPTGTGAYPTIGAAFDATTIPTHGDFVCISDASTTGTYSVHTEYEGPLTDGVGVFILSVSDTNCDQYSSGAVETANTGVDIDFHGRVSVAGLTMVTGDDVSLSGDGCVVYAYECTFRVVESADVPLNIAGVGAAFLAVGCTFEYNNATAGAVSIGSASAEFIDCTFTGATATTPVFSRSVSRSPSVRCYGCDFSAMTSSSYLIDSNSWDSFTADDNCDFAFYNCKLHSSMTYSDSAPLKPCQVVLLSGTTDTSAEAEYQYQLVTASGIIESDTAVYRDASQPYPSGQKVSLKCVTDSNCGPGYPCYFELPARYAKLSDTASDTVRIHFTTTSSLDDGDVWAEVVYPDGTNKHTANFKQSVTNAFDPFRTAGSLSTDTGSWTGELTNKYYIDLDTSGDAGADSVPIVRVYVSKASTTIYFDSEVEIRG